MIFSETFEALTAGQALGGQGQWGAQGGGSNPSIYVQAGSALDGVNSAIEHDTGGGTTTSGGPTAPVGVTLTHGHPYRLAFTTKAPATANGHQMYLDLTKGAPDFAAFSTDALAISTYDGGSGHPVIAVEDNGGSAAFATTLALGTEFRVDLFIDPDKTFKVYLNGALSGLPTFTLKVGNEDIDHITLVHDGHVPNVSSPFDSFEIDYGMEPTASAITLTASSPAFTVDNDIPAENTSPRGQDLYFKRQTTQEINF